MENFIHFKKLLRDTLAKKIVKTIELKWRFTADNCSYNQFSSVINCYVQLSNKVVRSKIFQFVLSFINSFHPYITVVFSFIQNKTYFQFLTDFFTS